MNTDPQLAELLLRWQELRQQGRDVTAGELCPDRPDLAQELQRRMETVGHWEQFLGTCDREAGADTVPTSFGKYQVVRALGEGGQASTLLAWDPDLHCHVVLKLYYNARMPAEQDKILSEGRALARVRSPYVVRCHGVERQDGVPALVVEYIPGRNLRQEQQARPLGIGSALELTGQLAEGLAAVHACGLLHRDLKPDNVLVGDDGRPRLVDFGLAAALASANLASISGTLPYMAPEQARGEAERIDARTDVYGLGAVLYELLTGRPPHQGASQEELWQAACGGDVAPPRQLNRRVPRAVNDLCLRCLAKDPSQRFASAAELAGAVRRLQRWRRWRPPLAAAAVTLVLVGLAAIPLVKPLVTSSAQDFSTPRPTLAPLIQVMTLDAMLTRGVNGSAIPAGLLGKKVFNPHLGDTVTVRARLTQPAYAFLIAFRPDGKAEVCFPEKDEEPPSLTDQPRYPSISQEDEYGLMDGAGLEVFAVVVSSQPLPAFKEWWPRCEGCPWQKADAPPGVVYRANGEDSVEAWSASGESRGKGVEVQGKKPLAALAAWLRKQPGVETVQVLGFTVAPQEKR